MAPTLPPSSLWTSVLSRRRVVVCAGPGGVGKTTTAAAIALLGAQAGLRVAALTVDPARRLADSLGVGDPGAEPREVAPERWRDPAGAPPGQNERRGSLTVMVMDTKSTFDEVVSRHASSAEARDRILNNKLYRHVSAHLAGAHEYMAMEKLLAIKSDAALDFLSAPERLVTALDSSVMTWLARALHPTRGLSLGLLARGVSRVLSTMGRITGRDLLEQLAAFVVDLNELFGGFRQRATAVSSAFRGPEFGFVLVASSRPTALDESLALLAHLEGEKMSADAFVLNRMPERVGAASSAEIEQALRDRAVAGSADLARRIGRAAADQDERAARADARVVKLQRALAERGSASPPLVRVPELRAEVQGIDGLRQIARMLAAT
jgi:anion-transporting  ArsA/GET3 family ATPase